MKKEKSSKNVSNEASKPFVVVESYIKNFVVYW